MLVRTIRYTLLVLTLLLMAVWGWSATHLSGIAYGQYAATATWGCLSFIFAPNNAASGFRLLHSPYRFGANYGLVDHFRPVRMGWMVPDGDMSIRYYHVFIPIGWLLLPILVATIAAWYRPVRNRLRGETRTGFEVEAKSGPLPSP